MKALLASAVVLCWLPVAGYAGDNDAPVKTVPVKPEVVEAQPGSSPGQLEQAGDRLPGNDRPGPATKALENVKETSSHAWEATKQGASNAADYTSEKAQQAWQATKQGTGKAVEWTEDKTSEKAQQAWQATKQGTGKAVEWTKDKSEQGWEATKKTADEAGNALKNAFDKAGKKSQEILSGD